MRARGVNRVAIIFVLATQVDLFFTLESFPSTPLVCATIDVVRAVAPPAAHALVTGAVVQTRLAGTFVHINIARAAEPATTVTGILLDVLVPAHTISVPIYA